MTHEYEAIGKGLRLLYLGEIAVLVFLPVWLFFPLPGLIGILISGIIALEGLNQAGFAHDDYHAALTLIVLAIVLAAVSNVAEESPVADTLNIINAFLFSLAAYYICGTSGMLLAARGEEKLARWAKRLWKLTVGCHMADAVCALIPWPYNMVPFAGLLAITISLISVIVVFMKIVFYGQTCKILLA